MLTEARQLRNASRQIACEDVVTVSSDEMTIRFTGGTGYEIFRRKIISAWNNADCSATINKALQDLML